MLTDPDATVALAVEYREWKVPPSIGQIEAVFTAEGRTQHRIWRIDVGAESAVVHVHPSDVAGCVGLIGTGQEIHDGEESGLQQWVDAVHNTGTQANWDIHADWGPDRAFPISESSELRTEEVAQLQI